MNPISGGLEKDAFEAQVRIFAAQHWRHHKLIHTSGKDDEARLREEIADWQPDLVVGVGGDGTVNLVGGQLTGRAIDMGIIPFGSGNGLSKDLDIPQETTAALELLRRGRMVPMDVLRVNGHFSFHLSDLGFNALVIKNFDEGGTRGPAAYIWQALKAYVDYAAAPYQITTSDGDYSGNAFMVTIANANMFGSNVTINPDGAVDDGYFEVCILEEFPKAVGPAILYQLYTEAAEPSVYSKVIRCRHARIQNPGGTWLQIDGELINQPASVEVEIMPRALRVVRSQN